MKPVDPDVYRRALDRLDVMKAALRKIAAGDRLAAVIARDALELVSITDAWDNAPLDAHGIPIPPSLETPELKQAPMPCPGFDSGACVLGGYCGGRDGYAYPCPGQRYPSE